MARLVAAARVELPSKDLAVTDDDREYLLSAGTTDDANARCVARLYRDRILYNSGYGWLYWQGTHFVREHAEQQVQIAVVNTLVERIRAASSGANSQQHDQLRKFCIPNNGRVQACIALLAKEVLASTGEFDSDPDLLNVANGVLDLRTQTLRTRRVGERFLACSDTAYVPAADQTTVRTWLAGAVGKDELEFVQTAGGYSLTGHTSSSVAFYLYGPPRSGKGVLSRLLLKLLGKPLGLGADFSTFVGKRDGDSQNFDLAPLQPCRVVVASETNSYERFNEAKLKGFTGMDEVSCAFKHRDRFTYTPRFKLWLSSNHPINADPDDDAVWGRFRVVEFLHSHLGNEDDRLEERLHSKAALEGALAFFAAGAARWYRLGSKSLAETNVSKERKRAQRDQLDAVGTWLEESTESGAHHFCAGAELYASYSSWCDENGVTPKQQRALTEALQRRGYRYDRQWVHGQRVRGFYGLRVL
jgi:putative DNA primase/helicase